MKNLVLAGIGSFMMAGFLPASVQGVNTNIECFGTTCGVTYCTPPLPREMDNKERAFVYDLAEMLFCDVFPWD